MVRRHKLKTQPKILVSFVATHAGPPYTGIHLPGPTALSSLCLTVLVCSDISRLIMYTNAGYFSPRLQAALLEVLATAV